MSMAAKTGLKSFIVDLPMQCGGGHRIAMPGHLASKRDFDLAAATINRSALRRPEQREQLSRWT